MCRVAESAQLVWNVLRAAKMKSQNFIESLCDILLQFSQVLQRTRKYLTAHVWKVSLFAACAPLQQYDAATTARNAYAALHFLRHPLTSHSYFVYLHFYMSSPYSFFAAISSNGFLFLDFTRHSLLKAVAPTHGRKYSHAHSSGWMRKVDYTDCGCMLIRAHVCVCKYA